MFLKIPAIIELSFYFFAAITLLWFPADYFDSGTGMCMAPSFLDRPCQGCGLTRACMHLIHFDIGKAIQYHPLCVVVAPLLASLILWRVLILVKILRNG